MIKQIPIQNLKEAFNIFIDVKSDMINNGIDQWDAIYPDFDIIQKDIMENQAFGYFNNELLIGYVAINEHFDLEYNALNWMYYDDKPLIVHRLAVDSKFQGMGIAKALIIFVENKAKNEGYKTIRLDAFSYNQNALGLYRALGYHLAGSINLRKGLFYCFEKMIVK